MPKRKTARLLALEFIDNIMQKTVKAHEEFCDAGKCAIDEPCAYCKINEYMLIELDNLNLKS
jgi:hypothetical protein